MRTLAEILVGVLIIALLLACNTSVFAASPSIYADDGTYLGRLSDNPFEKDSIANPYNQYGSPFSDTSINNPFGYGNIINYPDQIQIEQVE